MSDTSELCEHISVRYSLSYMNIFQGLSMGGSHELCEHISGFVNEW